MSFIITPYAYVNTYNHPELVKEKGYAYKPECSCCWLGHSHTYAKHYQNLLYWALVKEFGQRWQWISEREKEMKLWEREWWGKNVPFEFDYIRDHQTDTWNCEE